MLDRDFAGCLIPAILIICPYSPGAAGGAAGESGATAGPSGGATVTPATTATPGSAPSPAAPDAPAQNSASVLIVDDNAGADADEPSEAAIYLTTLTTAG